jgi:signal transduction histidine kinase
VIGNSLKFTEQGIVEVRLSYLPASSQLIFIVEDTGIGLSPSQVQRLFQPFSQGDSSYSRRFGGTGLGLSLSRKLAKILGGDVCLLKTEIGKGSTFRISLNVVKDDDVRFIHELFPASTLSSVSSIPLSP